MMAMICFVAALLNMLGIRQYRQTYKRPDRYEPWIRLFYLKSWKIIRNKIIAQAFILQKLKETLTDDYTLIRAIQAGDHQAFESLVRRYQHQVANLIYARIGSRDDAEDIAQEVFIRVYRSLPKFKFDASFFSWLYRITMNLCIDEIRRRKIRNMLSLDFLTEDVLEKNRKSKEHALPTDSILTEEKHRVIQSALKRLKPEHREILLLREYEDLGYNEIADVLGIRLEAVKSRIFRARVELKNLLSDYFEERQ
jgi:RNA polymerase sigma-70 factor, ECF subfamily